MPCSEVKDQDGWDGYWLNEYDVSDICFQPDENDEYANMKWLAMFSHSAEDETPLVG